MSETSSGVMLDVPVFESASVTPAEVNTGATITISAEIKIVAKWFTAESLYSGEINSGEV